MVSLRSLPIAFRALFSSFLILIGVGYLMALSYMYLVVIEPHQQMGEGLVAGISDEYHGLPKGTALIESALMGPMAIHISDATAPLFCNGFTMAPQLRAIHKSNRSSPKTASAVIWPTPNRSRRSRASRLC